MATALGIHTQWRLMEILGKLQCLSPMLITLSSNFPPLKKLLPKPSQDPRFISHITRKMPDACQKHKFNNR